MKIEIPFTSPTIVETEIENVKKLIALKKMSGDGYFSNLCKDEVKRFINKKDNEVFFTTSCTSALEASSIILELCPGDEVIMPSFTFVTTASSFANRGIKIKFVDIDKKTLNIDPKRIEEAITERTKAIVCVHYAGVSCDMDEISKIAKKHNLFVIEDAAQCIFSFYKDKHLGTIGDISTFSFHETKNIQCGEGGALFVNNKSLSDRSHVVYNKGTNRRKFIDGKVQKYSWVDLGASYTMSDLNAAFLLDQLKLVEKITEKRLSYWNRYYNNLTNNNDYFSLPFIPEYCKHNGHIFRISLKEPKKRDKLIEFLRKKGVQATFHFLPLHSSQAGKKFGTFVGEDVNTTRESQKILRLPIFNEMGFDKVDFVSESILEFFNV